MDWIAIRKEYESTNKTLKAVAEKHGIKIGTIKSRKSREGWEKDATLKKDATNIKKVATSKKDVTQNQPEEKAVLEITLDNFLDDSGLTEKQRLFCLYYVRSFNATQSAINAGYSPISAHVEGSRLLKNDKVAMHIRELKKSMASGLFIEAMDVLNKYIKIAFSDITDFLTFGQQQVPVMEEDKPVFDEHGRVMMQEVNYVDFKASSLVDGTIISEVKQGRNGVSIKLEDRMKALEKLELYFDLFPDPFKRRIEEERLNLSKKKSEQDERIVQLREEEARTKGW
jgi:phage terminase small subunit